MLRMRGGALAQLDNTRRTGHGYDERISLLGPEGVLESGSQTTRGVTLWQESAAFSPASTGLVQRVEGRTTRIWMLLSAR
jgi:myo-inositol 2-dehydrogenase/D-chiro-inositol 1-dehydrogenase